MFRKHGDPRNTNPQLQCVRSFFKHRLTDFWLGADGFLVGVFCGDVGFLVGRFVGVVFGFRVVGRFVGRLVGVLIGALVGCRVGVLVPVAAA